MHRSNHHRVLKVLAILVLSLLSHNCSDDRSENRKQKTKQEPVVVRDLDSILSSGKLTVAIANSSSSYFLYKGQPMGFEYELLKILADSLGVELEIKVASDLDQIFDMLNSGECDLLAAHLTVTSSRAKKVSFTNYHATTRQVLVQRKPANYKRMYSAQIERELIRNQIELIDKAVYVRKNSSYYDRLLHLSDEIGGNINIQMVRGDVETEELIEMVAEGKIDYTVADEELAQLNALYHGNIDVETPISFPQKIAWAVRLNAPALKDRINGWLANMKKHPAFHHLKNKYFVPTRAQLARLESEYNSESGGKISPYDDLIKRYSQKIKWDWRLLASLIYQESRFNNDLESWAGAKGLMQLMPQTARRFGVDVDTVFSAEQSIAAGVAYIKWLDRFWAKNISDSTQRIRFILASYNAGHGHVLDAWRLTSKYQGNPEVWDGQTEEYMTKLSLKKYYSDDVVANGYCRCKQPVRYVKDIISRYEQYKELIPLEKEAQEELTFLLVN